MYTYVISDIHGCYDEFMKMLNKINLSGSDRLILAGDYIDRGPQSLNMLRWLERKCPENIIPLKGNHDVEFVGYIRLLQEIDDSCNLKTDAESNEDTTILLDTIKYVLKTRAYGAFEYFDYYGTLTDLIMNKGVTFGELCRWAAIIEKYAYYRRFEIRGKDCVVVHAGFCESEMLEKSRYDKLEDFYIYAREEGLEIGGIENGLIVAGHTPTIATDSSFYNDGNVFRFYDEEKDCVFYDIDCGCAFRSVYPTSKLACLRLEDERLFYV